MAKVDYKNEAQEMKRLASGNSEVKEDLVKSEPKPVKRSIEFDDETKEVFFITEDDKEIVMQKPRTRQLVNVRKIIKKYEPELASAEGMDEELMARIFSVACVKKYGNKAGMSYEEYLDLGMVDGLLMARGLEFYKQEFEMLQRLV